MFASHWVRGTAKQRGTFGCANVEALAGGVFACFIACCDARAAQERAEFTEGQGSETVLTVTFIRMKLLSDTLLP
jgi:hypothetical protein